MTTETVTFPTSAELAAIQRRARQMQADAISSGFRALVRWLAHPRLHLRHA